LFILYHFNYGLTITTIKQIKEYLKKLIKLMFVFHLIC